MHANPMLPAAAVAELAAAVADYLMHVATEGRERDYALTSTRLAMVSGSLSYLAKLGDTVTVAQLQRIALDLTDRTPVAEPHESGEQDG